MRAAAGQISELPEDFYPTCGGKMITIARNGNDLSEEEQQYFSKEERWVYDELMPCEKKLFLYAKKNPSDEFTIKDVKKIVGCARGTARNIISALVRLGFIERIDRSKPAVFKLKSCSADSAINSMINLMTLHHHTVPNHRKEQVNLSSLIDSLDWEELCHIHNLHLSFKAGGLYGLFHGGCVGKIVKRSQDIEICTIPWSRRRKAIIFVHRGDTVSVFIKCSNRPIEVSDDGLAELLEFLASVKSKLESMAKQTAPVFKDSLPKVGDWVVKQFHYGRDSALEVSGYSFNVQVKTFVGEFTVRVYTHKQDARGNSSKVRMEVIQTPNKPLSEVVSKLLNPPSFCEPAERTPKPRGSSVLEEASDEGEGKNG